MNILYSLVVLLFTLHSTTASSTTSLRSVNDHERHLAAMEYQALMSATPPLQCFLEVGFDYVGNDIANVPSPTAEGCCWLCYNTDNCKAFSWTQTNGGTCWLKSARGQIIAKVGVTSSLLLTGTQNKVCDLIENVDYPGNDIGSVPSANAEGCCDICHQTSGCRAYTWTSYEGGTCWLKSKSSPVVSMSGARSAEVYSVDPGNCPYIQRDVDFEGYDIGNKPSPSFTGCCKICEDFQGCRSWTWTSYNGGTCWLKSLMGTHKPGNGVVSGVRYPNPNRKCTIEEMDVDYIGNDIGHTKSADAGFCADICADFTGCKAFSWSNHEGGICWLKSGKGDSTTASGIRSCVL